MTRSHEAEVKKKRERADHMQRIEDIVGPKEIGREGRIESKRAKRDADRQFRERSPVGDMNDAFLMGSSDSFKAS